MFGSVLLACCMEIDESCFFDSYMQCRLLQLWLRLLLLRGSPKSLDSKSEVKVMEMMGGWRGRWLW